MWSRPKTGSWNSYKDKTATRNLQGEQTVQPSVALSCILIPFAVAIWWFWSRGFCRKPVAISGLLTNGDNSSAHSQHFPASSYISADVEADDCPHYNFFDCSWSEIAGRAANEAVDDRTTRWFPRRSNKSRKKHQPNGSTNQALSPKSSDAKTRPNSQPACEAV